jgi:hypothetical protein
MVYVNKRKKIAVHLPENARSFLTLAFHQYYGEESAFHQVNNT